MVCETELISHHRCGGHAENTREHVVDIESALSGEHIVVITVPPTAAIQQVKERIQGNVGASWSEGLPK